jgi:hypothetical protein
VSESLCDSVAVAVRVGVLEEEDDNDEVGELLGETDTDTVSEEVALTVALAVDSVELLRDWEVVIDLDRVSE